MSARRVTRVVAVVVVLSAVLMGTASGSNLALGDGAFVGESSTERDVQETIWFQGFLADDGTGEPVNATYTVTARIYDAEVSGSSVWGPESHVGTVISAGRFNIELGNVIGGLPAFDTPPYYLQLTIDGELLSPRLKLASVPSAFQSLGADNGLNLPYYGSYGSSGDVFEILNTGPNRAGYFRINNPSSTAGALYGQHNGPGPAVMGLHTGEGPAIKGAANGTGLAGEFEGAVTVSDSLSVEGILYARGNAIVSDTLAVAEGFWFAKDPVPGYLLRCADTWGNAEWAPPNVIDVHDEISTTTIGVTVTQYDDAQVALTVLGPGYIVVEAQVRLLLDHTEGTADFVYTGISDSPSALPSAVRRSAAEVPSAWPTEDTFHTTVYVHNTFAVSSSGTYTYYLLGQMTSGQNSNDRFWYAHMRGIWYPYPVTREMELEEDTEFKDKMELLKQ